MVDEFLVLMMDNRRIMKQIASNLMVHFRYLVFTGCVLGSGYLFANTIQLPDFNEFNRGVNSGSVISRDNRFQGQPTDKLVVGMKSPVKTNWESHSTLTTGLFAVNSSDLVHSNRQVSFYIQSFGLHQKHSVLWVAIRFYDRHGVLIDETGGDRFEALDQWRQVSIFLETTKANAAYAEVWFVKFEDADQTGGTIHPVYLSGIWVE
jgi:hypothetical protein